MKRYAILIVAVAVLFATQSAASFARTFAKISGESVALFGTTPKRLLYPIKRIISAYGYASNGTKITFTEGVDFQIEEEMIRRTSNSRMFDFEMYRIEARQDGKFEWRASPTNPPLTVEFQVYVDYEAFDTTYAPIIPRANAPISGTVYVVGDSIANGAETIARHFRNSYDETFGTLLERHIDGIHVEIAPRNPDLTLLKRNLQYYIDQHPAAIIIEFGMNDRVLTSQTRFERDLDHVVRQLVESRTKVILVGFFQDNPNWSGADPKKTFAFNESIARIASRYNTPFIDLWSAFRDLGKRKDIYMDVLGDAFHHPNTFGHKIYFSLLLPYFLTQPKSSNDFEPNYVDTTSFLKLTIPQTKSGRP